MSNHGHNQETGGLPKGEKRLNVEATGIFRGRLVPTAEGGVDSLYITVVGQYPEKNLPGLRLRQPHNQELYNRGQQLEMENLSATLAGNAMESTVNHVDAAAGMTPASMNVSPTYALSPDGTYVPTTPHRTPDETILKAPENGTDPAYLRALAGPMLERQDA